MRKISVFFLGVILVASVYPVQQIVAQGQGVNLTTEGSLYFTGTVVAKAKGDDTSSAYIVVMSRKGVKETFALKKSTDISALRFNKGKERVSVADIRIGSKVSVRLSTDPKAYRSVLAVIIAE